MSLKQSQGQAKRWAKVSPAQRSKKMRALAKLKASSMTPEERKRHALKMVKARKSI